MGWGGGPFLSGDALAGSANASGRPQSQPLGLTVTDWERVLVLELLLVFVLVFVTFKDGAGGGQGVQVR